MMRAFLAFVVMVLALAIAPSALAYTPPPMTAHVTDTAHKLSETERIAIDRKLEDYRLRSSNEVAVFIPASLDGEDIADVGHATGRAWKLGEKGKDNGVLLIVAPAERKARIEVGKGVEGDLTDLQANDIIRQKIRPRLTPGSEDYRGAVDDATDSIISALDAGGAGGTGAPVTHRSAKPATAADGLFAIVFLLFVFGVPIIFLIVIVRAIAGAFSSNGRSAGRGWSSGSSWSNDSSWSSGGGSSWDGGGGGGGGGDSGFSGGGGDFGGGGSSDSF